MMGPIVSRGSVGCSTQDVSRVIFSWFAGENDTKFGLFFPPQGLYSIIVGVEGSYQLKGKIFVRNLVVVVATTAAF
jgi:hypothetical protein